MSNTSVCQSQDTRNTIIDQFDIKLRRSGYSYKRRLDIIRRGLLKYEGHLQQELEGARPLHRIGKEYADARATKKLI